MNPFSNYPFSNYDNYDNYDNYESVVEYTSESLKKQAPFNEMRQQIIAKIVNENRLVKLESDYYGTDSYYYSKERNIMYKVSNMCDYTNNVNPKFEVSYDRHIIELNNLPI